MAMGLIMSAGGNCLYRRSTMRSWSLLAGRWNWDGSSNYARRVLCRPNGDVKKVWYWPGLEWPPTVCHTQDLLDLPVESLRIHLLDADGTYNGYAQDRDRRFAAFCCLDPSHPRGVGWLRASSRMSVGELPNVVWCRAYASPEIRPPDYTSPDKKRYTLDTIAVEPLIDRPDGQRSWALTDVYYKEQER